MRKKTSCNCIFRRPTTLVLLLLLLGAAHVASADDTVDWLTFDDAVDVAAEENKILLVFVEADWCATCRQMKRAVFPEEKITQLMQERYVAVSIDLDSRDTLTFEGEEMTEREFARTLQVAATPTMIFISPRGEVMGKHAGFLPADRLHALLRFVDSDEFEEGSFEEFYQGG